MRQLLFIILIALIVFPLHSQNNTAKDTSGKAISKTAAVDRNELITFAKKYLGISYRHAGSEPSNGFDCSGFVSFVFKNFNINLPHASKAYQSLGTALKPEEFKVGDVIIFYGYADKTHIGHVGIICEANGMNSRFIHSSSGPAHGVTISELGSGMYTRRFYKCINVIN